VSVDWAFRTLILAAQDAPLARQIAETLAGAAGAGMWISGLSADGAEPATHYVSTGRITPEFAAMCPVATWEWQQADPEVAGAWVQTGYEPGNAAMVAAGCAAAEVPLAVTEAQVEAIYGRSDVTQQEPFEAFARLGLAIVQREALK